MGNLAGHALEANIGGVDALEANIVGVDALEANIVGVSMLRGADGITPTIGENDNWYLGETDTGKPSRGEAGPQGLPGIYYGTTQPTGDTHPVWIDPDGDHDDGGLLPAVTSADNGKVLRVVGSAWSADDMPTGGTDMGITGAEVGQIAKITAVDESGVPTAWSPVDIPTTLPNPNALTFTGAVTGSYDGSAPLSVEIPSGGGGIGTGAYEFSVLASGTIPANTITAAEIGNGMIDTGITLGMLRQYKVFNMLYRCDSGNQYYSFTVGNPGQPLYTHKRFYYATSNAMNATILWLDSARTAVLMLGSTGNTMVTPPEDVETMGSFLAGGLCSAGGAMSSINAYGNLADFTDESKIYVGVMNMNGKETNTKDFTWAICGVVK